MTNVDGNNGKTLARSNLSWLVAAIVLDLLALLLVLFPEAVQGAALTGEAALRGTLTALLPIPILILSSLLSANQKAMLVFWRRKFPLPGSRAFTVHAPADQRIDLKILKLKVGEFPVNEREQNAKWYALYKQVESEMAVVEAHKRFLMFRDLAAVSALLVLIVPVVMYFSGVRDWSTAIAAVIFLGQWLTVSIAARHSGVRLVQNVLAIHAADSVPGS